MTFGCVDLAEQVFLATAQQRVADLDPLGVWIRLALKFMQAGAINRQLDRHDQSQFRPALRHASSSTLAS